MSNNEQIIVEEAGRQKTRAERIAELLSAAMGYEGGWPEARRLRLIQGLADALRCHYQEEADECQECRIDNREMEILRLSESLDNHKKMLAQRKGWQKCETHGEINADHQWGCPDCLNELRAENKLLKSEPILCDHGESLKRIADLECEVGNLRAANDQSDEYICELREQIEEAKAERHDDNCDTRDPMIPGKPCNCYLILFAQRDRLQGYLRDAVNALEAMPVSDDTFQWEKYQRWAEGLRRQTVDRIKRELNI